MKSIPPIAPTAVLACLLVAGCTIQRNKDGDHNKDVRIATPFGGLQVKTDKKVVPAEIGLPLYPGASPKNADDSDSSAADVNMNFGNFQLRVKAATYQTPDPQEKVEAFYRDGLKHFGDVIACRGEHPIGTPVTTSQGLTCANTGTGSHIVVEEGHSSPTLKLKAGSRQHQHVVTLYADGSGTTFRLISLDLPGDWTGTRPDESRRQ